MSASASSLSWIPVPPSALKGDGLKPYDVDEIAGLFDWAENMSASSAHLLLHGNKFLLDIVEIEENAVHQPSKPGDEVVRVLNGTLILTTDASGLEMVIKTGEVVFIPAGWAGTYKVRPGEGHFLELALVPFDYFDGRVKPQPNEKEPSHIKIPLTPGVHQLFQNRYKLFVENHENPGERQLTGDAEDVIQVLTGVLTLSSSGRSASFGPGDVVMLPVGLEGTARVTAGCRLLVARWDS